MAKGGILLVAEIGILYLTIYNISESPKIDPGRFDYDYLDALIAA